MADAGGERMDESEVVGPSSSKHTDCPNKGPVCVIVLGMAGSGKTTLVQQITRQLKGRPKNGYVINLDPAVVRLPYEANVDIRDTVKYKEVMKQYKLGPNGAIMTSMNLFATRFDQLVGLLEKRGKEYTYAIFDTPGQIEVFTWSASGTIITETLASTFPTVVVYVVDASRSENPVTFMSNMLYACSILYRSKLPFFIVLNKSDVVDTKFAVEWMTDFEAFQKSLDKETSYASDLTRSLSLVLDEFYADIKTVSVSSTKGTGMDEFFEAVEWGRTTYEKDYWPEYERLLKKKREAEVAKQAEEMDKFHLDSKAEKSQSKKPFRERLAEQMFTKSDVVRGERFRIGAAEIEDEEDEMLEIRRQEVEEDEDESFQPEIKQKTK